MKKADLQARCDDLERERTLLGYALRATMRRTAPTATERWREGDDSYRVDLYDPHAPHGGFVIVTFRYPGQSDTHSVFFADSWARDSRAHGIAVGNTKLAIAAERILHAARTAA